MVACHSRLPPIQAQVSTKNRCSAGEPVTLRAAASATNVRICSLWSSTVRLIASSCEQPSSLQITRGRLKSVSDSNAEECRSLSSTFAPPARVNAWRTIGL